MTAALRQRLAANYALLFCLGLLATFWLLAASLLLLSVPRRAGGIYHPIGIAGLVLDGCMTSSVLMTVRTNRLILTSWSLVAAAWLLLLLFYLHG